MTRFAIIVSLFMPLIPCTTHADMDSEIDHLLQYIETSDCTFIRNEETHDSQDAVEHIRTKYAYAKRRIKSAEDFIRYAATKSSMSGKPYQVICSGIKMPTAEWLTDELSRFRRKAQ